jgi:hypothetical protein
VEKRIKNMFVISVVGILVVVLLLILLILYNLDLGGVVGNMLLLG